MFFDTALVDLDDTLYSYRQAHQAAIEATLSAAATAYAKDSQLLRLRYTAITGALKSEVGMTAASHNRFIYFKQLCIAESIPLRAVERMNQSYWNTFYATMQPAPGARELLIWLRANHIRIAILTDFQIEYQFEKLRRLNMLDLVDDVITSEEVGVEKPNSKMFLTALAALNATADRTVMIGDSFEKDVLGASHCGIESFLIATEESSPSQERCKAFASILELNDWLNQASMAIKQLGVLSRYCGIRFDLTQAAGGNISVKFGSHMVIKSSGYHLADVDTRQGFSMVDNDGLKNAMANGTSLSLGDFVQFSTKRPSIETFMHAALRRYTVHLHPLQINAVLTSEGARERLLSILPEACIVDYLTPGLQLANALKDTVAESQVIFLLNHGAIFTSDSFDEILPLIEGTLKHFSQETQINWGAHQEVNTISALMDEAFGGNHAVYLCEDIQVQMRFTYLKDIYPSFPDAVVYCGESVLNLDEIDVALITGYAESHGVPKLILRNKQLYIVDSSLKKCRDTEAVLKSVLMLEDVSRPRAFLDDKEVKFLGNWDAEKYRRQLQ